MSDATLRVGGPDCGIRHMGRPAARSLPRRCREMKLALYLPNFRNKVTVRSSPT